MVTPLALATMASQAMLVVLGPTMVAIADDLGASVGTVGQARAITAAVAVTVSVFLSARADRQSVPRLLLVGSALAVAACGAVAASASTLAFLGAHALVGLSFALLLSGGFAGVAAFPPSERAWATGYVASANALAWILVNPLAATLTERVSWRAAQAVPAVIALAALVTVRRVVTVPVPSSAATPWAPLAAPSARRWLVAEVAGFAAWTALLTFAGAFFIDHLGVRESTTGWILAAGAAAYLVASTRAGDLARLVPGRRLASAAALLMAALLPLMLGAASSVLQAAILFCVTGLVAGVRTPSSAALGLQQLPGHPAAMMAARTAATQLGYLLGAIIGGALIAGPGYTALGLVLAVVMVASAWLMNRVDDRLDTRPAGPGFR
jgi:predicted MFS family arabinose efflux permease